MNKSTLRLMTCLALLSGCTGALEGDPYGTYEVYGVEAGDMLKLRSGPGTVYRVLAGLPNGATVHARGCQWEGSVRWCKVSLEGAGAMVGYVSASYLHQTS